MTCELTSTEILLLDDAGSIQDISIAFGTVQLHERHSDLQALTSRTSAALIKLFDCGLIRFFRASRDLGYNADPESVVQLTRPQVLAALEDEANPKKPSNESDVLFFVETAAGRDLFASLPEGAIPKVSGQITRPWET